VSTRASAGSTGVGGVSGLPWWGPWSVLSEATGPRSAWSIVSSIRVAALPLPASWVRGVCGRLCRPGAAEVSPVKGLGLPASSDSAGPPSGPVSELAALRAALRRRLRPPPRRRRRGRGASPVTGVPMSCPVSSSLPASSSSSSSARPAASRTVGVGSGSSSGSGVVTATSAGPSGSRSVAVSPAACGPADGSSASARVGSTEVPGRSGPAAGTCEGNSRSAWAVAASSAGGEAGSAAASGPGAWDRSSGRMASGVRSP